MKRREFLKMLGVSIPAALGGYALIRYLMPEEARRGKRYKAKVVIVGGGLGGSTVASLLAKHVDLLIVEPSNIYVVGPAKEDLLLGLSNGEYVVEKSGGPLLHAYAIGVRPEERELYTTAGLVQYEYLVLAPGIRLAYEGISVRGPLRNLNIYDDEIALAYRGVARGLRGRIVIAHPDLPYRCTSAPYEFAFLVDYFARDPHEVIVVSGVKGVPAEFSRQISGLGDEVFKLMEERGIQYVGGASVVEVNAHERELVLDTGEKLRFDHLSFSPPHSGLPWLSEAGLAEEGRRNFVVVDDSMRARGWDDVYAVGDIVWHIVKTGWAAYTEGLIAAASILSDLGIPTSEKGELYSEDSIRITPNVALRGAKKWWPIYGEILWRIREGPNEGAAELKYAWMRRMKEIVASTSEI